MAADQPVDLRGLGTQQWYPSHATAGHPAPGEPVLQHAKCAPQNEGHSPLTPPHGAQQFPGGGGGGAGGGGGCGTHSRVPSFCTS
eukprot:scaffold314429_cov32-Tisochrysis_lutea.AAC.2